MPLLPDPCFHPAVHYVQDEFVNARVVVRYVDCLQAAFLASHPQWWLGRMLSLVPLDIGRKHASCGRGGGPAWRELKNQALSSEEPPAHVGEVVQAGMAGKEEGLGLLHGVQVMILDILEVCVDTMCRMEVAPQNKGSHGGILMVFNISMQRCRALQGLVAPLSRKYLRNTGL